jgi:hypothetical protein
MSKEIEQRIIEKQDELFNVRLKLKDMLVSDDRFPALFNERKQLESELARLRAEGETQTTESGKTYHRVPFWLSVETWDKLTPAERLKFKGLIVELGEQKETVTDEDIKNAAKEYAEGYRGQTYRLMKNGYIKGVTELRGNNIYISPKETSAKSGPLQVLGFDVLKRNSEIASKQTIEAVKKSVEQSNFMQSRELTDEEWLKLPKEEILQLYKNCYSMLKNYIGLSGEKIKDVKTFTSTDYPVEQSTPNDYVKTDYTKPVEQSKLSAEEMLIKFQEYTLEHGLINANFAHAYIANRFISEHPEYAQFEGKELPEEELRKEFIKFLDWNKYTKDKKRIEMINFDEYLKNR